MVLRWLGALALLSVGAVHLEQFLLLYSGIPTIGVLFVVNFAGATVMGLGLLAPLGWISRRWGDVATALFAAGGIALAAVSFALLVVSEHTPLFGFMEPGYDPPAILTARAAELVTVVLLGAFLFVRFGPMRFGSRTSIRHRPTMDEMSRR